MGVIEIPIPSIEIRINPQQAAVTTPLRDDVVGIVGPVGSSGSGAAGTLVTGDAVGDFAPGAVDAASETGLFISQMLNQVEVETVWSPTVASPTATQVATAMDLLSTHDSPVSFVALVGNLGDAAPNRAKLQSFCADSTRLARGIINAVQTGSNLAARTTAAVTGTGGGLPDRLWAIFNKPSANYATGAALGAMLRTSALRGRQWGIQMIPVTGAGALQDSISLGTPQLTTLDNAGISTLITAEGATRIAGGYFNYSPDTNPLRDWSVARVVDHAEHLLRRTWLTRLVGTTLSLPAMSSVLEETLQTLVGSEIAAVGVVGTASTGASRTFDVSLNVITPAGNIIVNITLVT